MPLSQHLHQQIDRCVMCGICSQYCPTYALNANENESPRGRLALIAAINQGQLTPNRALFEHLDHCLGCRACERSCPSQVHFGDIMDQARDLLEPQRPMAERRRKRIRHALFARPRALRLALAGLRWIQKTGLSKTANAIPPIPPSTHWRDYYPPQQTQPGHQRGDVALFLGCVNQTLGQNELRDTIHLLTAIGYGVHVPARQTCCGALHKHNGDIAAAKTLAQQNLRAFNPPQKIKVEAILHTASGCTAMLKDYASLFDITEDNTLTADDVDRVQQTAHEFSANVQDINAFIAAIEWPENVYFSPLKKRVAIHSPCSLKQVLRQADAPFQLLRKIPDIDLIALPDNGHCCGGAGSYMLNQPDMASRLRADKLRALTASQADVLVTSNIGCALHLRTGLLENAQETTEKKEADNADNKEKQAEILHPITLLVRQLLIR